MGGGYGKTFTRGDAVVTKKSAPLVAERTMEYNASVPFRAEF